MGIGQTLGTAGRRITEHDYRDDLARGIGAVEDAAPYIDDIVSTMVPNPVRGMRAMQQGGSDLRALITDIMSGYERAPGLTGSATAGPAVPLKDEVRPADLAGEEAFMRQFAAPAAGPAAAAPAPPPKAAPPAPTKQAPLNARQGMGDVHVAERAEEPATASGRNPSAQNIREKLGFSWGPGVKTHDVDGVARPVEDDVMTLTAPDFTPGVSAPHRPETLSRTPSMHGPDEVLQVDRAPAVGRREQVQNSQRGGGYAFGENADSVIDQIARETNQRRLERTQVGTEPAPATRGEMLDDQRKTQRVTELAADRDQKLAQAQAMLAHGDYTPEEYAAAVDGVRREFAMLSGVDPRWSQVR